MGSAWRRAAALNALAAFLTVALMLPAPLARAESGFNLVLPLVAAVALASGQQARASLSPSGAPALRRSRLLPTFLHIPDGYAEDYDVDPPRFAAPVDADRFLSIDLLRRPRWGWMPTVAYDEESRGPLSRTSGILSFAVEYDF